MPRRRSPRPPNRPPTTRRPTTASSGPPRASAARCWSGNSASAPRSRPDPTSRRPGPDLDYFAIQFVFDEADPARPRPDLLRVGPAEGPPVGWVPADCGPGLGHPADGPADPPGRPAPAGGLPGALLPARRPRRPRLPAPRRPLPDRGRGAAGPTGGADAPVLGLPILRSESIPQPDGPDRDVFEVASLVADRAPRPPRRPSRPSNSAAAPPHRHRLRHRYDRLDAVLHRRRPWRSPRTRRRGGPAST